MKDVCTIYRITNLVNGKVYIGQTWNSLEKRFWRHANDAGCPKIHRAICKYGKSNFVIEPILSVLDQTSANEAEIAFIQSYDSINNGYNLKLGGDGGKHCEETRKKMSASHKGLKRSEQACKNIAAAKMGNKNPMYGKPLSEEHRRKQSKATKGTYNKGAFKPGNVPSLGSQNSYAKLNEEKVAIIKCMLRDKISESAIAKQFNVTRSTIAAIHQGRSWKHVT